MKWELYGGWLVLVALSSVAIIDSAITASAPMNSVVSTTACYVALAYDFDPLLDPTAVDTAAASPDCWPSDMGDDARVRARRIDP